MNKISLYTEIPINPKSYFSYDITKISYKLSGRAIFKIKNGVVKINEHFPLADFEKLDLNFNHYYISLEEEENSYNDFDVGFNNFNPIYETKIIFDVIPNVKEIYVVLRPNNYDLKSSLFDKFSENFIEKIFYTICLDDQEKEYLVKIEGKEDLLYLNKFVVGYLINPKEGNYINVKKILGDIEEIDCLTKCYDYLIIRSSYYVGYNISIYTRKNIEASIWDNLNKISKEDFLQLKVFKRTKNIPNDYLG